MCGVICPPENRPAGSHTTGHAGPRTAVPKTSAKGIATKNPEVGPSGEASDFSAAFCRVDFRASQVSSFNGTREIGNVSV